MRDDMAKVIVERPRAGGRDRHRAEWRRTSDWKTLRSGGREDESPRREKIAFKWSDRKVFTDFLNPLVGFVRKNVGRPWDKVHSEIAAKLDRGNTVQRHVLEHLERDIVRAQVVEQADGTLTDARLRPLRGWRGELFWVCPRTGLLRTKRVLRRRWSPPSPSIDVTTPYHEVGGVWYAVAFAPLPRAGAWDVLLKELGRPGWGPRHWKDGGTLHAVSKRQLGSREIRRLGLRGARSLTKASPEGRGPG